MIGIVILNYNTWQESIQCSESIIQHTQTPFRIYLVDNMSPITATEKQIEKLEGLKVEVIQNAENSGYAAGNNVGLKKAYEDGCDQFLISNSDVLFKDNSIDRMSEFLRNKVDAGIVGPIIYDVEGKQQPIHMLSKLTASGKIKNMLLSTLLRGLFREFRDSFVFYGIPETPLKVFGVSGCCFLVSRNCYEKVFPFDEHTFLYEEEYILGCRLESQGIDAYILPNAHVVHAEAVSTGGMSAFSYKCLMESEQYYLREYIGSGRLMLWIIRNIRKLNWKLKYDKR